MNSTLSGDVAYQWFMSNEPFPMLQFLDSVREQEAAPIIRDWLRNNVLISAPQMAADDHHRAPMVDRQRDSKKINSGFVLAVIRAYDRMVANCGDGRYHGKIRKG